MAKGILALRGMRVRKLRTIAAATVLFYTSVRAKYLKEASYEGAGHP